MFFTNVSLVSALVASIVSMGIGLIWYSPWVIGKIWMREMGYTPEALAEKKKGMAKKYALSFLSTFVTAYALAVVINSVFAAEFYTLVEAGFVLAIGFIVSVRFNDKLFKDESWTLFLIHSGYQILSIVSMSVIIGIIG